MAKNNPKIGIQTSVIKFYLKTVVATYIIRAQINIYFILLGLKRVYAHAAASPTETIKNNILSIMLPVDNIITTKPNITENNPPIKMVHGTTFKGKNCNNATKMIAMREDTQKLLNNASYIPKK